MTQRDWQQEPGRTLGVFLNGDEIPSRTARGEEIVDDSFLLLLNAHSEPVTFTLPTRRFGALWEVALATGEGAPDGSVGARAQVLVQDRSLTLLRRT
jgi:glycogen operon protein